MNLYVSNVLHLSPDDRRIPLGIRLSSGGGHDGVDQTKRSNKPSVFNEMSEHFPDEKSEFYKTKMLPEPGGFYS